MKLPIKNLYCPKLACDVYDYIGFMQPLLGTTAISLGDILDEERHKHSTELIESAFFIKELRKIMAKLSGLPIPNDKDLDEEFNKANALILGESPMKGEEGKDASPNASPLNDKKVSMKAIIKNNAD
jgi:hypothetical protein